MLCKNIKVISQPDMEKELQGVVVSSVAVKVKPAHPVIGVAISSSLPLAVSLSVVCILQAFPSF
jgi:hypothetical protein